MTRAGPAGAVTIPDRASFVLADARVPRCFLDPDQAFESDIEDIARVDICVRDELIVAVDAAGSAAENVEAFALDGGQVWPAFVELHTHIDKGHIWPRRPNPDGSFEGALESVGEDRAENWSAEDVRTRMEFSLRCAFAHGTKALRTHIDTIPPQHAISWPVFSELRDAWAGRIALQAASIFPIDAVEPGQREVLADTVADHGGILGAVTFMTPDLKERLRWLFEQAAQRDLDLDFHVDETMDPSAVSLEVIADTALETGFEGTITCGHCCSLSRQADGDVDRTLDKVAAASIAIVSLPMCNMFLQDRHAGRTPRWRGVTLLHELKARGVRVAISSDNTRDPFYGYGDLDGLEVFTQAVRIAQLDRPVGDWPLAINRTPADVMGLAGCGRIASGEPADLVLFRGRGYSELLSRPQRDRVVLRGGQAIDTTVPDYRELDRLMEGCV